MIRIATNFQTPEQIVEFLQGKGYEVAGELPAVGADKTAKEATAATEVPGETIPAETGDKSAAVTEPAKDKKSQETAKGNEKPAEEGTEPGKGAEPVKAATNDEDKGSKGGFRSKVDKLTRQQQLLQDQLEMERGSKVALQKQLDEVNAKLAAAQPAEPAKPAELVRPKRPTMADCEYDAEKLEVALGKYDVELDAFHDARSAQVAQQKIDAAAAKATEDRAREAVATEEKAFGDRLRKSAETIEGYDERWQQIPEGAKTIMDNARVVRDYILKKSQDPAHLLDFFVKDFLEGGDEAGKIEGLDEFDQLIAVKALEDQLIRDHKAGKNAGATTEVVPTPAKQPAKAADKTPDAEVTPAKDKDKPAETPGAPIGPRSVGSKVTATRPDTLEKAAEEGPAAYRAARTKQLAERQAGRV